MSITGAADDAGGEPTKVGVALVDILTGLNAVIGIQAALRAREVGGAGQGQHLDASADVQNDGAHGRAGQGQHVKVTLLGSLLSALANQASSTLETGKAPGRMGNAHPSIAPYAVSYTHLDVYKRQWRPWSSDESCSAKTSSSSMGRCQSCLLYTSRCV